MPTALILGASRGIGLGLASELVGRGWSVTGTARGSAGQAAIRSAGATPALADITDAGSLAALHASLDARSGPLDLLFINAGITGRRGVPLPDATAGELGHLFLTNAVAPVAAAGLFVDLVPDGGVVAFSTSQLGSVANARGNMPLYSASKAALNSLTRAFAATLGRPVAVLSLHPGWVRTDMGGDGADLDVATSARGLADVVVARRGTPGSAFLDYKGDTLPW